ncbi:hypothetical protein [Pseudomonas fluorescens]|uniref:hypothetical protein n=1 Tax=Pseudomonas fluorescens TaxID=294 RepID=UPI0028649E1E|nr:hypothetical protein [Pseudomonas fluorescens]MDR6163469.1 hypothetical protein [Pseudomonas fluorescens]
MPIPSSITDLSQTAGSNSPAGSESPSLIDDYLRTYASYIAILRDSRGGRLLRTSIYTIVGGVLKVSVDGAAPVNASAAYTPIAGALYGLAEVIGGGGGGGGCFGTGASQIAASSGGGAGGYAASWLTAATLSGVTLSVGGGGISAANSAGASGATTSIGALLSATGGVGGTVGAVLATPSGTFLTGGASGGIGSNGNMLNAQGGLGSFGVQAATPISGSGGGSVIGAGGMFVSGTANGQPGVSLGSGGGGSSLLSSVGGGAAGGSGASGMIRIRDYS